MTFPLTSFAFELVLAVPVASSPSSKVVALVEYEPCADELRLCGGEASCSRASAAVAILPSPPLSREEALELR